MADMPDAAWAAGWRRADWLLFTRHDMTRREGRKFDFTWERKAVGSGAVSAENS